MDSDHIEQMNVNGLPPSIKLLLQFGQPHHLETELIEDISEPHLAYTPSSEIQLQPLIAFLKVIGYPLGNSLIWYFSNSSRQNVYSGTDPLPAPATVPLYEMKDNTLCIICSKPPLRGKTVCLAPPKQIPSKVTGRKIGYIIEQVSTWRSLHTGASDSTRKPVKLTLDEAAARVDISKKSLDDYLLQLRFGQKFGFNFEEHREECVGILRRYVKKMKSLVRQDSADTQELGTPVCKDSQCCRPTVILQNKELQSSLLELLGFN